MPIGYKAAGGLFVPQRVALAHSDISTPDSDTNSLITAASVDADGWVTATVDTENSIGTDPTDGAIWRVTSGLKDLFGADATIEGSGLLRVAIQLAGIPDDQYVGAFVGMIDNATWPATGNIRGALAQPETAGTVWDLYNARGSNLQSLNMSVAPTADIRYVGTQFPISSTNAFQGSRARNAYAATSDGTWICGVGDFATENNADDGVVFGVSVVTGSGAPGTGTITFRPLLWYIDQNSFTGP